MGDLNRQSTKIRRLAAVCSGAILLSGCERQQISSYEIPKENYSRAAAQAGAHAGHAAPARQALPHVHWELPPGWEEHPAEGMRVGVFTIKGEDGKMASVGIVPFPGAPPIEAQTVNMWREALKLEPLPTNAISGVEVDAGGYKGQLHDLVSQEPVVEDKFKGRTLAAMFRRDDVLWFVKMSGEDGLVASQRAAFINFLKTLTFHDEPHESQAQMAATPRAEAAAEGLKDWKKPANWKQETPGNMVLAAYTVTGSSGKATITVTSFPGDVGGLIPNINRWRGQVGLPAAQETEIKSSLKEVKLADGAAATLADLKGPNSRLAGLIVKRGANTWFYKMVGDDAVVGAEKDRLIEFAATAF